jgi:hypothetical protein
MESVRSASVSRPDKGFGGVRLRAKSGKSAFTTIMFVLDAEILSAARARDGPASRGWPTSCQGNRASGVLLFGCAA